MCIYQLIHFGCGHSVGYAQRFHFSPAAQDICFQRLLTLNRWLRDVDCPHCRLRSLRGFPYVTLPFGIVVRDDSAFKTAGGKWPSDVDEDKDTKRKGKGCVGCGIAKNKDGEGDGTVDTDGDITPATTEDGDAVDTPSGTGTPAEKVQVGNEACGEGHIFFSAIDWQGGT